ncbi:hypothetical protein BC830DRAFT_1085214 [Chytriomyces sp. MP71]|nr:hypothetical protein BC830DRAFT_1085214 [Chytriomyces sp. MP71]
MDRKPQVSLEPNGALVLSKDSYVVNFTPNVNPHVSRLDYSVYSIISRSSTPAGSRESSTPRTSASPGQIPAYPDSRQLTSVTSQLIQDFIEAETAKRVGTPWERRLNGISDVKPKSREGYVAAGLFPHGRDRAKTESHGSTTANLETGGLRPRPPSHAKTPQLPGRPRAQSETPRKLVALSAGPCTSETRGAESARKMPTRPSRAEPEAHLKSRSTSQSIRRKQSLAAEARTLSVPATDEDPFMQPSLPLIPNDNIMQNLTSIMVPPRPKQPHRKMQVVGDGSEIGIQKPSSPASKKRGKKGSAAIEKSAETASDDYLDGADMYQRDITEVDIAWLESVTKDIDSDGDEGLFTLDDEEQAIRQAEQIKKLCAEEEEEFTKKLIPLNALVKGTIIRDVLLETVAIKEKQEKERKEYETSNVDLK